MPTIEELNEGFTLGDWEVLPGQGLLRRGDEEQRPEPKVFKVLLALAQRDGNVVSPDELIDEVWEGRAFGNEPIQRCINLLRRHFEDSRPYEYIDNLPRRGYRLLKPVELRREEPPGDSLADALQGRSLFWWKTVSALMAAAFIAVIALTWIETPPAVKSLAIMPIENQTGSDSNQYIVDGIKNSLSASLTELDEFKIRNVRGIHDGEPNDISIDLDVESMLYSSIQMHDGTMMFVYEIVRGADGVIIAAGEVSGELDKLFVFQHRIASAVRDELAGSATPQLLVRALPPDAVAYDTYIRGMYALGKRFKKGNLEQAIRLFGQSIDLDESYGPAYVGLATAYALLPDYRDKTWAEYMQLAWDTAEKGVALDPTIDKPAAAVFAFIHYQRKEWALAEAEYERALDARVVDSNTYSWYSLFLSSVGRLHKSRDIALAGTRLDPDSTVVNSRLAMTYVWLNDTARAEEYFERAKDLDAMGIMHEMTYALLLLRTGRWELARSLSFAAAKYDGSPTDWIEPVFRAFSDPAYRTEGLAAINAAWDADLVGEDIVFFARAALGDPAGALQIARLLERPGIAMHMQLLFLDEVAEVRRQEEFMTLLDNLGVLEYWRQVGCEWENDALRCAD